MIRLAALFGIVLAIPFCDWRFVGGDAERTTISIGDARVIYCADDQVTPQMCSYIDYSRFADNRIETFESEIEIVRGWSLVEMDRFDGKGSRNRPIACKRPPRKPYEAYIVFISYAGSEAPDRPRFKTGGKTHTLAGLRYHFFTRNDRVFMIDVQYLCGKGKICHPTADDLQAEMERLGVDVPQPQQAVE